MTQPLAFHQTGVHFWPKKGPFFINCDPDTKGIHNFFHLEIKPQPKYNKLSQKNNFTTNYFVKKSNPSQNPSCFWPKRGKNGSHITNS